MSKSIGRGSTGVPCSAKGSSSPSRQQSGNTRCRDGKETAHDKLPWSFAGEDETKETGKSFITPELAEIHLPAQGGENTSSGRLQVAVRCREGKE